MRLLPRLALLLGLAAPALAAPAPLPIGGRPPGPVGGARRFLRTDKEIEVRAGGTARVELRLGEGLDPAYLRRVETFFHKASRSSVISASAGER